MDDLAEEDSLKGDAKIVHEAKRRFDYVESVEASPRSRWLEDLKFAEADSDNKFQWPDKYRMRRDATDQPCLTINIVRQHNLHIINDVKQNPPSIKIIPVGDGATFDAAQVFMGITRHIEYISNASDAYEAALEYQVKCGIGYWRIATDYADGDSFDQEIFIRPIRNPLNVYLDTDIQEKDGSDARFGFVFDDMSREEFNDAYPKYKNAVPKAALGDMAAWSDEHHVRVVEYFRMVEKEDKLISVVDPQTGNPVVHRMSNVPSHLKEMAKQVIDLPETKYRTIVDKVCEHFLIVGEVILERTTWPGKYIPIIRVIGEESCIEGDLDRKGHTRFLKDQQRMFNYNASQSVAYVAKQTQSPFLAPAQAIEGLETYWENANTESASVLPYNHKDDDGVEMQPPQRLDPPTSSAAYLEAMQNAEAQMEKASGQFEATFGQPSNERSGVAINNRKREGETATAQFRLNLGVALRYSGKILIDLIPKIYDTQRVIRIMAEDGTDSQVQLDPQNQQAYMEFMQQQHQQQEQKAQVIFNPNIGTYDVQADYGKAYATRREETEDALTEIFSRNPNAFMMFGDIWAKNSDIAGAEEIGERIHNMLPPQALGNGPDPQSQELQAQLQKSNQMNAKLLNMIAEMKIEKKDYSAQKDIDVYKAETDRMEVEGDILDKRYVSPRLKVELMHELAKQEHQGNLDIVHKSMDAAVAQDSMDSQQDHEMTLAKQQQASQGAQ